MDQPNKNGAGFTGIPADFEPLADLNDWRKRRDEREARERAARRLLYRSTKDGPTALRASPALSRGTGREVDRGVTVPIYQVGGPVAGDDPNTASSQGRVFDPADLPDVARIRDAAPAQPDDPRESPPDLFSQTGGAALPRETTPATPHTPGHPGEDRAPRVFPTGNGNGTTRNGDPAPPATIPADAVTDARGISVRGPSIPADLGGCDADLSAETDALNGPETGVDLGLLRNLQREFVSGELRAGLVAAFPMMEAPGVEGEAASRLVAYLGFGVWVSETTGRLILGNQTLADIAGVPMRPASVRPDGSVCEGRWERGYR